MKLSFESKLTLAKLLVLHSYNRLDNSKFYLNCSTTLANCSCCKVHRICNHIESKFLYDHYINNYPELFV